MDVMLPGEHFILLDWNYYKKSKEASSTKVLYSIIWIVSSPQADSLSFLFQFFFSQSRLIHPIYIVTVNYLYSFLYIFLQPAIEQITVVSYYSRYLSPVIQLYEAYTYSNSAPELRIYIYETMILQNCIFCSQHRPYSHSERSWLYVHMYTDTYVRMYTSSKGLHLTQAISLRELLRDHLALSNCCCCLACGVG